MRDDISKRRNSLLLLPWVEHFWVKLEVGIWLVLARLQHITLALLALVRSARLHDFVPALDFCLRLQLTLPHAWGGYLGLLVALHLLQKL